MLLNLNSNYPMQNFLKELLSPLLNEKQSYRVGGSHLFESAPSCRGCLGGIYVPIYYEVHFWKNDWKLHASLDREVEIKNIHQVQTLKKQ